MIEFFDSRLLRWLTAPYRNRLAQATARPFLAMARRLLGGPFLARIAEFFWLLSTMRPGFVARAEVVKRRLGEPSTGYVVVATSEASSVAQSRTLLDALRDRNRTPAFVVHNRALPTGAEPPDLDAVADTTLRTAIEGLVERDGELVTTLVGEDPTVEVVRRSPGTPAI